MKIRESCLSDRPLIESVHMQAFGEQQGGEIAALVHELCDDTTAAPILSLVAVENERIIGHVLFTKATLRQASKNISARILAPLAVVPDAQKKGIGGMLIEEGLDQLKKAGTGLVFVLGHPGYYPRFGFTPAGALGFEAPHPVPEKHAAAWMVHALRPGIIGSVQGTVQCSEVLNRPGHWRE
jgi:predicted N-acetyltransferase YhbS